MATKIITVEATPPSESTGADYNKGAPLNAAEFDQNIVNLRAAVDRKAALNNPTFTGTVTLPSTTSIGDVSATELQYLSSVTSNVQDQINSKQATITTLSTNHGGTGLTSFTSGGVVYASSTSALTTGSALTFDGSTFATTGAFSSTLSTGQFLGARSATTGNIYLDMQNTGGEFIIGLEGASPSLASGTSAYDALFRSPTGIAFTSGGTTVKMRLDSSGNLLVGTTNNTPYYGSIIYKDGYNTNILALVNTNSSQPYGIIIKYSANPNSNSYPFVECVANTTQKFVVYSNGNCYNSNGTYGSNSDRKLKENIVDCTPKLEDICKVQVRNFNLISDPDHKQIGVIAQELEEVFPGMIDETPDYEEVTKTREVAVPAVLDEEGNEVESATTKEEEYTERVATGTTTKSVKYSVFVPMLVKAVQELNAKVDSQQSIIESLTERIAKLEAKGE